MRGGYLLKYCLVQMVVQLFADFEPAETSAVPYLEA